MNKKTVTLFLLALFCVIAYSFCEHCIPVNEPTDDPCSIAGWCGNGNPRARRYVYSPTKGWHYTPCIYTTGEIACSY